MGTYQDLIVWQKSIELCVKIYKVTEKYPKYELFGLTSQTRRCTVSIPSNIAEGQRRGHKQEFKQFLRTAYGSGAELETQLIIAHKIGYLTHNEFTELNNLLQEIMKMLNSLIKSQ